LKKENFCLNFKDIFEMQESAIKPGQKVLIVDDLIATGGLLNKTFSLFNVSVFFLLNFLNFVY
jgi:adenine/guanine phosphoribosyltransferase-like PRPP-binding protein